MVHPVQSVIESLYAAGLCPRLHVNAVFEGVVCPDFIREQWRERLIIDLDPTYPLKLAFEPEGLAADLSFNGYITRCRFPYGAVYVVADRSTGRGIVLDQNMPESVKRTRYAGKPNGPALAGQKPALRTVTGAENGTAAASDPSAAPASAPAPAASAPAPADEDLVKKRRAGFKVIDGGG